MIAYLIANFFKDVSRYVFIPFIVIGLVFLGFGVLISGISIINVLLNGNGWLTKSCQLYQIAVYFICEALNYNYRIRFAKRDLLRTEEEEIEL